MVRHSHLSKWAVWVLSNMMDFYTAPVFADRCSIPAIRLHPQFIRMNSLYVFSIEMVCWRKPAGVALVDGIVPREPVEVDAPRVPNRVARDEPPRARVVGAVGQQVQAAVVVVVALLPAEAHGVVGVGSVRRGGGAQGAEGVEGGRGAHLEEGGLSGQVERDRLDGT